MSLDRSAISNYIITWKQCKDSKSVSNSKSQHANTWSKLTMETLECVTWSNFSVKILEQKRAINEFQQVLASKSQLSLYWKDKLSIILQKPLQSAHEVIAAILSINFLNH